MENLTPTLNDTQLRQNIDAMMKQNASRDVVQKYVDNYMKAPGGGYVLKTSQQEPTPESQGAVKQADGTYRGPTFMEGLKQAAIGAGNYFGKEAISLGQGALNIPGKAIPGYDTRQQAIQTGEDLKTQMNPQNQAQQGGAIAAQVGEIALPLAKPVAGVIENAPKILSGAKSIVQGISEFIKPSLNADEEVGKIIQGKTTDIPAATRTFNALPKETGNLTKLTPQELSTTIEDNIIQKNLNKVDALHAIDNIPHTMADFTQTTGTGKSAVKMNYVQQAIDQLKAFYTKVNDAVGLSDIQALEEKANTTGLNSQELNNLAKEHGTTIKAFNANGEAASGLSKQAAENTRTGVKATARNILAETNPQAAKEATLLDKQTADAIKTKDLLENQVEKGAVKIQKSGKPNIITKFTKEHPVASKVLRYGIPVAIYEEAKKLGAPLP